MRVLIFILFSFLPLFAFAQQGDFAKMERTMMMKDTTLHLNEVVVSGSRILHKVDRDIIIPTKKTIRNSTNGYDLLRKLKLPNVEVSEVHQNISSYLGNLQVRINDAKATVQDILALQPDEVTRIEYIDNPGVRYGSDNLAIVINYIVKRRYAGYVGGATTTQAFTEGFNNSNAYFKYNNKKSEFSVAYRLNYRYYDKRKSDNYSVYYQPDGTERCLNYVGQNAEMTYNSHNMQFGYNLSTPDKYTLNVKFGFDWTNAPYNYKLQKVEETGKPDLLLYTKDFGNSKNPSLDIYYNVNLPRKQNLTIDIVGTHLGTDNHHHQNEYSLLSSIDKTLTSNPLHNYGYDVNGSKYSLITEAIYSKILNKSLSFSGGTNYNVSRTDNKYSGSQNVTTILNSNNLYLFTQIQGNFRRILSYQIGMGANYISIHQGDVGFNKWIFIPKFSLSSTVIKHIQIRLSGNISPQVPSLSQLSEVRQQSSSIQANDGNELLKATSTYNTALNFAWNHKLFDLNWGGSLGYTPDAIMTSIIPQQQASGNYLYVWKPENQKSFTSYFAYSNLTLHIIKDVFDIQGELHYQHLKSRGLDYSHDFEPLHYGVSLSLLLNKWYFEYTLGNAWESLYGECRNAGENQSDLMISYRNKGFRLELSCLLLGHPKGFDYKSSTHSKYYVNKSNTYIKNNGNMVMFTLGYTFNHGRTYKTERKKINNRDTETGIR